MAANIVHKTRHLTLAHIELIKILAAEAVAQFLAEQGPGSRETEEESSELRQKL